MRYKVSVAIFALIFFSYCIINAFAPKQKVSVNENKYLAEFPCLSVQSIIDGDFESGLQSYVNDHLFLRESFIKLKSSLKYITNNRENNGVYIMKDNSFSECEKPWEFDSELFSDNIITVNDYLKDCPIKKENRSVMVVPASADINSSNLPPFAPTIDFEMAFSSLENGLSEGRFVNTRNEMLKSNYKKFYATDHHWTSAAAFNAYKLWQNKPYNLFSRSTVSQSFYGTLYSKTLLDFGGDCVDIYESGFNPNALCDGKQKHLFEFDALQSKDKYEIFLGGNYAKAKIYGRGKGKLLILKDSFANSFVQFLVNDYSEIHLLDLRYYNGSVNRYIKDNNIDSIMFLYGFNTFSSDKNISKLALE